MPGQSRITKKASRCPETHRKAIFQKNNGARRAGYRGELKDVRVSVRPVIPLSLLSDGFRRRGLDYFPSTPSDLGSLPILKIYARMIIAITAWTHLINTKMRICGSGEPPSELKVEAQGTDLTYRAQHL